MIDAMLKRPVAVTALYVALLGLAAVATYRLPVALLPSLQYPSLVIWTAYADSAPQRVEEAVSRPIEDEIAGVGGLRSLYSRSFLGGSMLRLDFTWAADLDLATFEVQQKLDRLAGSFPEHVERPVVFGVNPSDRPILVLALSQRRRSEVDPSVDELIALKEIADNVIARRLEQLDGVARVRVSGGFEPEIEVLLDPGRLASHQLSPEAVAEALDDANFSDSSGTIRKGPFRYNVELSGQFEDVDDIRSAIVSSSGRPSISLREVATVRQVPSRRLGLVRLDQREVLLLLVERRPDGNTVETAAEARELLAQLRQELAGVDLQVVVDESDFIEAAFRDTVGVGVWGGLLAVLCLFLFLRDRQSVLAVASAVPLSVAIAMILFDAFGLSFNLISLGGLALGMGMLVDNAIVVVDNVARYRRRGAGGRRAAAAGTREVVAPLIASTATTLAVFLPLTFVDGLAGRLFRDQSLAVVCALSASLFVALTAVPLLASRRHGDTSEADRDPRWMRFYAPALDTCLGNPRTVLVATLLVLVASGWIGAQVPRQAVPAEPASRLAVEVVLPAEAALPLVAERSRDIERVIAAMPGVHQVLADLGERDSARLEVDPRPAHAGSLTVILEPGTEAASIQNRVLAQAWPADVALQVTPVRSQLEALLLPDEADLLIDLECGDEARRAETFTPVVEALAARSEIINVAFASATDVPAFELQLRRDLVRRLGADAGTIGRHFEAATSGRQATALRTIDRDVPIVLRTRTETSMSSLLAERVDTASGLLSLGTFLEIDQIRLPAALLRADRTRVVRLHADLAPGVELTRAIAAVRETVQATAPGVSLDMGSSLRAYAQGAEAAAWSLFLSLFLVYLILAAQFESLLQPLTVLATVPPAIAGVALGLAATGATWNLISLTGTVVLAGIAVNGAIVLVDFFVRRQRGGLPLEEAIRVGGRQRLRAVLITSSTTILGMLPLALGLGDGGTLRRPLAVAVIGGLILSTLSTLFVVPVVYRINVRIARRLRRFRGFALGSLPQEVP